MDVLWILLFGLIDEYEYQFIMKMNLNFDSLSLDFCAKVVLVCLWISIFQDCVLVLTFIFVHEASFLFVIFIFGTVTYVVVHEYAPFSCQDTYQHNF